MTIKKSLYLGLIILSLFSCSSENNASSIEASQASNYTQHGVSFSIPGGWKKTEAPIPETGVYIMIEKEGEDESGQFIASILDKKVPLGTYMKVMQDELTQNLSLQGVQIDFTTVESEDFNQGKALVCEFAHNSGGLNFKGILKTFHCGPKTVYIFTQEEEADTTKNKAGMKILQETFTCK